MNQEKMNLNISLDKTTPVACDECGHDTFQQVLKLRTASKFLVGGDQDMLIPIPVFACSKCGHINDQFQPKEQA